jgi:thiol-disulfide isomerase/thioredoxin
MKRAAVLGFGLVAAAALAAGTWLALRTVAPAPPAAVVSQPPPTRLPDIRLAAVDGTPRALAEWSDRPQLVNFWATWCAPCRKEMPLLEALHQQEPSIAVIGIAIDRAEPVQRFIAETGVSYPILRGEADAMAAAESFGSAFAALPFTVIAAPGGDILAMHTGELDAGELAVIATTLRDLAAGRVTVGAARDAMAAALRPE